MTMDAWGLIPTFLDPNDPRPAREQFDERYVGGWNRFEGFHFDSGTGKLHYPDDPPMAPLAIALFRRELLILYPYSWVLIMQPSGEWEVARMD